MVSSSCELHSSNAKNAYTGPASTTGRSESPGRALQEIKAKLNQFTGPQQAAVSTQHHTEITKGNSMADLTDVQNHPVEEPVVFDNASAEIADIDQRLHALQTFLRAAKAGGAVAKPT